LEPHPLGTTGLFVTKLCFGTSALGSFPAQYGYEVSTDRAIATLRRIFSSAINFIDTSNEYGNGESERRIGQALAEIGGLKPGFVLATKVDPTPGSADFSASRVRKSVEESLERLGVKRLQLVYLHDPEKMSFAQGVAPGGAVEALVKMRDEGLIEHIGVAGGPIDLMLQYLATGAFGAVISHNRYTLIDQAAEPLIAEAARRKVAFINAAPYGGGILVKGPEVQPNYCYARASAAILRRVGEMQRICAEHRIPLAAAALQFSMRDPRVASTIVGISTPERVEETLTLAALPIPNSFWSDIAPIVDEGRTGAR